MTVETFFANFGHLADAPNGVQKLRELILQLAVQGKLVPQDPSDEPASVLLERIEAEKASLVKKGMIRKTQLAPISPEEKPCDLPSAWTWVRFGSIAQHNAGKTLDKGRNTGQLRDYITTSNLYWGYFDLNNVRQMPIEDEELERCTARTGDLLIVEGGEAGRAAVWTKAYEVCFQNHVHRARFFGGIDPFYVYRFFEKMNLSGEIIQYRKGVGISNMSGKALSSIVFPLPPLEEQKRIVAKVDQLMALCDELEARQQKQQQGRMRLNNAALDALLTAREPDEFADHWQRISSNFDLLYDHPETIAKLRAAILQLAVQGKLVPQDPNDEPASVLLERIKAEKERLVKNGKIKKEPWAGKLSKAEKHFIQPNGWKWTLVSNAVEKVTVGFVGSMKKHYVAAGIPFLRTQNVRENMYRPEGLLFINEEFHESISKSKLRPGDVVVTRSGNVGVSCVIPSTLPEANCSDLVIIKRPMALVPEYLCYYLNSFARKQIADNKVGIALTHFNTKSVAQLAIPAPPFEEQKRIVAKVDQLMALCDELEAKLKQAQQHSEKLMEATVRQLLVA